MKKRVADAGQRQRGSFDHHDGVSNPGSGPSSGAAMAIGLEQFAHAVRAARDQPRERDLDVGRLARRARLERGCAFFDAEAQEQIALPDRAVNARAHAFRALRQRFEIDMGGQIGFARRAQRIGEGMAGDRLQRIAQAVMVVTVIDDQGRAVAAHAASQFEREIVRAPFVDRAGRRLAQSARHRGFEMRQRIAGRGDTTGDLPGATSTTRSCQPSACLTAW